MSKNLMNNGNNDGNGGDTKRGRLIPLTKWPEHHPWPPVGGLRHLVFYAKEKGFDPCVVRAGGRVLIDEDRFFKWAGNNTYH